MALRVSVVDVSVDRSGSPAFIKVPSGHALPPSNTTSGLIGRVGDALELVYGEIS